MLDLARARRLVAIATVLPICFCLGQPVTGGGSVVGSVKDAIGAAIPGAKVGLTHLESGVVTRTVTNQDGYFATPPINIGKYRVRIEHEGLKAWEAELLLETGRTVDVSAILSLGQVSETVQVTAAIPL